MADYILALDQGTTGSTALVLDRQLRLLGAASREFAQHFPRPGWVEHRFDEIWDSMVAAIGEVLAKTGIDAKQIAAIGITNQRETCGFWDRQSGAALGPAIVWQCRRTAERCDELIQGGHEPLITGKTGLVIDAYFSATKAEWLLREIPGLRARAEAGAACFGTIDSYLVHRLTAGVEHLTDVSNASRTMLFDIDRLRWDEALCERFGVPAACLPKVVTNAEVMGKTRGVPGLPDGIVISGMAGDQQAALFGQACFTPGMGKCTYGTGAFMLQNVGPARKNSGARLLSTVAWKLGGEVTYALEGSVFIAGALVQWLRDGLGIIARSSDIEALAASVSDSGGVTVVPAFSGLGAPHWRQDARGIITGITRGTTKAHIARASLEAIALQVGDVLTAMRADAGPFQLLRVDGGAAENDLLMQFQADVLEVPLSRPQIIETTGFGAGCLAAIGAGLFTDPLAVAGVWREARRFLPSMDGGARQALLRRWQRAVAKA